MKLTPVHNNVAFDYVASAVGYMRMPSPLSYENQKVHEILDKLNGAHSHKFSVLYNSFVEPGYGKALQHYKEIDVYADSGGLQVVTTGAQITPDIKRKVYANQAEYSDFAMSFDELPLSFRGGKSSRLDVTNRWFDLNKFESCARLSGQNIREQIEFFLDKKTKAKPFLIVQGNCKSSYDDWLNICIEEIGEENLKHLGGYAYSSASFGFGLLEEIKKNFYVTQAPVHIPHYHILGVGSVSRLIATCSFVHSGLFHDMRISYDSTTHTSGVHMGRAYINGENVEYPKTASPEWKLMHDEIQEIFGVDIDFKEFYHGSSKSAKDYGDKAHRVYLMWLRLGMSIWHFTKDVETVLTDFDALLEKAGNVQKGAFKALKEVKTNDDFEHWLNQFGRFIETRQIGRGGESTLDSFF